MNQLMLSDDVSEADLFTCGAAEPSELVDAGCVAMIFQHRLQSFGGSVAAFEGSE